jgi:fibronectin type 3 domain-containing protein
VRLRWRDNSDDEDNFRIDYGTSEEELTSSQSADADEEESIISGLSPNTTYYFCVCAENSQGASEPSDIESVTTLPAGGGQVPAAPTGLTASPVSASTIDLSWTDNSDDEDGFEIHRSLSSDSAYSLIHTTAADATSYSSGGLSESTTYYYRVYAKNGAGLSGYAQANATTGSASDSTPPSTPANLNATAVSSSQINLSWNVSTDNVGVTGYKVYRGGTYLKQVADTSTSDSGLSPSTTYTYTVSAVDAAGNESSQSASDSATTQAAGSVPANPTGLNATPQSSSSISLSWNDNSNDETGFRIYRRPSSSSTYVEIDTTNANVETYTDLGLSASTTYYYRVYAYNGYGESASYTWDSATTESIAPASRVFRAQKATDGSWYNVPSDLLGIGDHVLVYVEDGSGVSAGTAQAIANEFDANIYDMIRASFAEECDVDGNDRIILLLLDIVDGFSGSGGYVAGYFDATHLFSTSTYANSNEADMLFLDTYPASPASQSFYSTAAHEMQHLVNFANTYMVDGRQQDLWINEGLSSGAEYLYAGQHIASRISYFNADPNSTIRYGNNFFVWNGYWENNPPYDVLADYATVYLFFQWLRIHASNDSAVYKDILLSDERDYRTVVDAAYDRISSTLDTWEKVLRTWMQANMLCSSSGLRGYGGEISTVYWYLYDTSGQLRLLSPGESIFAQTVGGYFTDTGAGGTNIRYNGINTSTGAVDTIGTRYDGNFVLAFNSNSSHTGADEWAVMPLMDSGPTASFLSGDTVQPAELPEIYPVDVTLQPGGGLAPDSHRPQQAGTAGVPPSRWTRDR